MSPDLHFLVLGAEAVTFSASPLLAFKLSVRQNEPALAIHTIVLRCQVRIDPHRRQYADGEQDGLRDLFDRRERWGQTLRSMLWTHTGVVVPPFTDAVTVDLPVPCTFDFNVAATKYFHALEQREVPLTFLFSGTIFFKTDDGGLQVSQIAWEKQADYHLPVTLWKEMMEHYYPNCAWLCLGRDAFSRFDDFKRRHGLPTFEAALERLIP
ncbi:MAG TPA: DUF6084 family protein [Gemmataceae bacterium]|nr:DUF6084 family protein [Gemmataceae bacterium]